MSKMRVVATACAAILLPFASVTWGQADNVRDSGVALMLQCNVAVRDGRGPDSAACVSYLLGIIEGVMIAQNESKVSLLCFKDENITATQLAIIYVQWAQAHPDSIGGPRHRSAYEALRQKFKC
jgi:hypothetical protein